MKKTIGIIGGMGPLATCDLFEKIIRITGASRDQDHIHVIIDSNTQIPDRTAAILGTGPDPAPQMCLSARRLEQMGADLLIMPCNTAHFFIESIRGAVSIPIIDMTQETALLLSRRGVTRAGLLATDGTIRSGVYEKALTAQGIKTLLPDSAGQAAVMDVVYNGIKAGNYDIPTAGFISAMDDLLDRGAQTLILGCTELPVAFSAFKIDRPCIDPTLVLAAAAVRAAGAEIKPGMGI